MIPALLPEKGVKSLEVTLRNNSHVKSSGKQAKLPVHFGMVVGEYAWMYALKRLCFPGMTSESQGKLKRREPADQSRFPVVRTWHCWSPDCFFSLWCGDARVLGGYADQRQVTPANAEHARGNTSGKRAESLCPYMRKEWACCWAGGPASREPLPITACGITPADPQHHASLLKGCSK